MAVIDIGGGATDRAGGEGFGGYTCVDLNNPANDTGTITSFEIWLVTMAGVGVKIGTFSGSGTSYDDRDYETIGAILAGSKQTFSGLNCDVVTGDFVGYYGTAGTIEKDDSFGAGLPYINEDTFGQGVHTYTAYPNRTTSIYGAGTTAGWAQTYELSCTDGIKLDDTPSIYRIIDLSVSDGFKGSDTPAGGLLFQLLASDGLKLLAGQGRLIGSGDVSVDGYLSPNTFYLSKFTARFTNTGTQFKIYTEDAINAKVAIYADSTGEPGALLNALNAAQSLTAGWNTLDFPATSIIAGTAYWLGFNSG